MRRAFSKPRWGAASLMECVVIRNVPRRDLPVAEQQQS
jgi:hypothetical protein